MTKKAEITKFETIFSENRLVYAIWGYNTADGDAEKLLVSENAEEAKKKMIDLIQNSDMYEYDCYGISLSEESEIAEAFDFYNYYPEDFYKYYPEKG